MGKVLSVGQCGYDDSRIGRVVQQAGATFERAAGEEETLTQLAAGGYGLVLVNRVFDADGSAGLELIPTLRQRHPDLAIMLVSDHADAQAQAVSSGAVPGFGKSSLGDPRVVDLIKAALGQAAAH